VRETGDTIYVLVGMEEVVITRVTKTLVPQETFCSGFDRCDRCVLVDEVMERNLVEGGRNRFKALS